MLDRFSRDVYGVLEITEIEERLLGEVREVLGISKVNVVQKAGKEHLVIRQGLTEISQELREDIIHLTDIPECEIIETRNGYFVKLCECKGEPYFLCISDKPSALKVTPIQVWLKTITRYVSALYDNFRIIEDLTQAVEELACTHTAPSWLLRLLFNLSENERKRLSQDLHDSALQDRIVWYRKLHGLSIDLSVEKNLRETLTTIAEGLLD